MTWALASGQAVNQAWNATVTTSGSAVAARNVGYNGSLGPGADTVIGFLGSWSGTNPVPPLTCTAT